MIDRISTVTVRVADQDRALEFYTDQLGFEKRMDTRDGDFRWLTVAPPGAATQIVLYQDPGGTGGFGGLVFHSSDIQRTYEQLSARGVRFTEVPTRQKWGGMQAQFVDQDGNNFVLTEM